MVRGGLKGVRLAPSPLAPATRVKRGVRLAPSPLRSLHRGAVGGG